MRGFRPERVGSLVREVLAENICFRLQDPRIAPLTTVTRVEVSGDLMVAKVFLSIPGGDAVESRTLAAICHAGGHLQRIVAGELNMRHCPTLSFEIDESAKIALRTLALLDQNRRERGETPDLMDEKSSDEEPDESAVESADGDGEVER